MGLYSIKSMIPTDPPDGGRGKWWKYEISDGVSFNIHMIMKVSGAWDKAKSCSDKSCSHTHEYTNYESFRKCFEVGRPNIAN